MLFASPETFESRQGERSCPRDMPRIISFDLDDTLICYQPGTPREPNRVPRLLRPWFREPLIQAGPMP